MSKVERGNIVRHVLKRGGKNGMPLTIDDLNEEILANRLQKLDSELTEFKSKNENEWYRTEMEEIAVDTAHYLNYLQAKRTEKETAIAELLRSNEMDMQDYLEKRAKHEAEYKQLISTIHNEINDLESKILEKENEIALLSDTMTKRTKHEAEINKIKQEMENSRIEHQRNLEQLEKSLLDTRIKFQKEAEVKIRSMESAAQEKASKYLAQHTSALEKENQKMERELLKVIHANQELLNRKQALERENKELEREQKLRQDLIDLRVRKVKNVVENRQKMKLAAAEKLKLHQEAVVASLNNKPVKLPMTMEVKNELSKLENPENVDDSD